jgi:hypothetical protein
MNRAQSSKHAWFVFLESEFESRLRPVIVTLIFSLTPHSRLIMKSEKWITDSSSHYIHIVFISVILFQLNSEV